MNRVSFLVDGFNLYHSLRQTTDDLGGASTRWLDLVALCDSHLHVIGDGATLAGVFYFSALALHLIPTNPDIVERHRAYLKCLADIGVHIELSRFKAKTVYCNECGARLTRHEEKETDVAIAMKLFELLHLDVCDTVVLVSGDTDLAPAMRTAQRLFPEKRIVFGFPHRRKNSELAKLAPSFRIGRDSYVRHQLPDPYVTSKGRLIAKPVSW